MTTVRLAAWAAMETNLQSFQNPVRRPALLCSYMIADKFVPALPRMKYRDWVLDSGAFTAHTKGKVIDLDTYIRQAKEWTAAGTNLTEVFALDVISDWREGIRNTERMWKAGVQATPCYHRGEPWDVLVGLARDYPRIALGGAVGLHHAEKLAWSRECFSRVWPKPMHGFGINNREILEAVPFATVDATNWAFTPALTGKWLGFTPRGRITKLRTPKGYNLECEVAHYLRMEKRLKYQWRSEMREIGVGDAEPAPLAAAGT